MNDKKSIIRYTEIRVRYQETDKMGIAYHSNYFNWFEVGRNEFFRELDMPYTMMEDKGIFFPLVSCNAKFSIPAEYDDILRIGTQVISLSPVRMGFCYSVEKDGSFYAEGHTEHVFVNKDGRPFSIKKHFPELWNEMERAVYERVI